MNRRKRISAFVLAPVLATVVGVALVPSAAAAADPYCVAAKDLYDAFDPLDRAATSLPNGLVDQGDVTTAATNPGGRWGAIAYRAGKYYSTHWDKFTRVETRQFQLPEDAQISRDDAKYVLGHDCYGKI